MSKIKSLSVGNGDMFYINHNSDNFTIIDCCITDENIDKIIEELKHERLLKGVTRFISTHPDEDHLIGLEDLDYNIDLMNFYCIENNTKKEDPSDDFKHYCKLRDSNKAFYIKKDCFRKWMNKSDEERGSSGINILWPDTNDDDFQDALKISEDKGSPNNTSAIIKYSLVDGVKVLWMGDLETDFMEKIKDKVDWPEIDILFAPHHGRESGKVPIDILEKLSPKIIVLGEAPFDEMADYSNYNKIRQNSAGDITFVALENKVQIFVSNEDYAVDFLDHEYNIEDEEGTYIGTLML